MPYTKIQEARLKEFDEITYLNAVDLGVELNKSTKSIVSKAQHLEIPYIKKDVPTPKAPQATKAELLVTIGAIVPFDTAGLAGATRDALVELLQYVNLPVVEAEAE